MKQVQPVLENDDLSLCDEPISPEILLGFKDGWAVATRRCN